MASTVLQDTTHYRGLRMTADDYFALRETLERYELIDGVVCMSPSPSLRHQQIIIEIASQIRNHLDRNPVGVVAVEIDVRLSDDLVYRPDVIFLSREKASRCAERVTEVPDVIVEIVSPDSRRMDAETKKGDYERYGVAEYWLIDPERNRFDFFRLESGRFVAATAEPEAYSSQAIPGFALELARLRVGFR